jgi:hypothetical protein
MGPRTFEPGIDVVLRIFAVLVGVTLANFLNNLKDFAYLADKWVFLTAFAALTALGLRLFIGTAYHLKMNYLEQSNEGPILLFFKDVVVLMVMGFFLVHITHAPSISEFMRRALLLLGVVLCWDLLETVFCGIQTHQWPRKTLGLHWLLLDAVQFLVTFVLRHCVVQYSDKLAMSLLGTTYIGFLGWDCVGIIRIYKNKVNPPHA